MDTDAVSDDSDPFQGLVLDEGFVQGGRHEPPAGTRANGRGTGHETAWRPPIQPVARPHRGVSVSWIFLVLLAVFIGSAVGSWQDDRSRLAVFGFVFAGWLISLCLHEFAHAATAYCGGDRSVATKGYLSLDIRRYVNPAFSFILPALFVLIGGIGLPGGAVWIDQASLRTRAGRSLTSLAGPFANLVCAAACVAPFAVGGGTRLLMDGHLSFWSAVAFLGFLQLFALLLNLLPIPGLDGWGAIEPYLPAQTVAAGRRFSPFGFMLLFFVVMSSPSISGHLTSLLQSIQHACGVPGGLAGWGYQLMRFWSKS